MFHREHYLYYLTENITEIINVCMEAEANLTAAEERVRDGVSQSQCIKDLRGRKYSDVSNVS